jgi:hypothetical protein
VIDTDTDWATLGATVGRSEDSMKRALAALALTLLVLSLSAPAAQALRPDRFQPGPAPDLVVEGVCDFDVLLHDVVNQITITTFVDRDGNVVRVSGAGRIIEEISRLDEQGEPVETITVNISGPGQSTFDDEGETLVAQGPWLFFFLPGEVVGHPDGLIWLTTGRFVWRFDDAGVTLVSQRGTIRDVCDLLA